MNLTTKLPSFRIELQLKVNRNNSIGINVILIPDRREERMKMYMSQVVETVSKKKIASHVKSLVFEICCNDESGEDVEVPFVQYRLPDRK